MKINTIISESESTSRAVDSKGRTQREWINLVRAKFPEVKIVQSKMIDGPVHAVLPDGRKTSWSPSVDEARASSASFRSSNARRGELNAMSPEERKAHDNKRAEQQRKRDDARLARERAKNVAEATMTPDQIAAAQAAAPYGYNTQTGKPNPAPAATAPATAQPAATTPAAPAQPAATTPTAPAAQTAPAATTQSAVAQKAADLEQKLLNKIGARAGAAPGSNMGQVTDAYQQKILDRVSQAIGLPAGSQIDQVQTAQQAYLDKNDPTTAAQYKQQIAKAAANPDPDDALIAKLDVMTKTHMAGKQQAHDAEMAATQQANAPQTPLSGDELIKQKDPDFYAGMQAQKAGGSPVDIMLAQPAIAGNQKLVDAIGSAYGLPPGSSVEQVKAAAKGTPAAPAAPAQPAAPVAEAKKKEKEADYGDDYQDMVSRVKKLAGLGPLKTVYDPAKRVYKNIPTAVQPKK